MIIGVCCRRDSSYARLAVASSLYLERPTPCASFPRRELHAATSERLPPHRNARCASGLGRLLPGRWRRTDGQVETFARTSPPVLSTFESLSVVFAVPPPSLSIVSHNYPIVIARVAALPLVSPSAARPRFSAARAIP